MSTRVKILSKMAESGNAIQPGAYPTTTWEGEVELAATGEDRLEEIFRLFNRVEESDGVRLEEWGYRLPSLSVGDEVTLAGSTYRVASAGFEETEESKAAHRKWASRREYHREEDEGQWDAD